MLVYVKFMKDLLSGKCKLKYDENITLVEELNEIIQLKHPLRLTDSGRFTSPCSIGSLTIDHSLCDFGARINLIPLKAHSIIWYHLCDLSIICVLMCYNSIIL